MHGHALRGTRYFNTIIPHPMLQREKLSYVLMFYCFSISPFSCVSICNGQRSQELRCGPVNLADCGCSKAQRDYRNTIKHTTQFPTSEAGGRSATLEILRLSRNPKYYCRIHKRPQLNVILGLLNCVSTMEISLSLVTLISTPKSLRQCLVFRFTDCTSVYISHLSFACYMFRPINPQ